MSHLEEDFAFQLKAIVLDGLDDAVIGQTHVNGEDVLVYSADKIVGRA